MNLEMNITDRSVTTYIRSKYKPESDMLVPFRNVGERDKVPIILKETESVLSMLLDLTNPKRIFEIGTAIGYSTAFFALSCPDAAIYSAEKEELPYRAAQANMKNAELLDRVHLYLGDGEDVAKELKASGINGFDFIFIDAAKSHYMRFLDAALEIAADEALIVSDNILQHGMTASEKFDPKGKHKTNVLTMRAYLDYLEAEDRFRTTFMSVGDGLAVTRYRRNGWIEK